MEQSLICPMEKTHKIFRRAVHIIFQDYRYFVTAAVLTLPYTISVLLSQALIPSVPFSMHFLREMYYRLSMVFRSAGLPPSSVFLSLKLSQAVITSTLTLPFSLFFLLPAKVSVIQLLTKQKSSIYFHLFTTFISNSMFMLSANASALSFSFFAFGLPEFLGLSASAETTAVLTGFSAAVYSILLANSLVICNLALVISGTEKLGGVNAILRAFVLSRGEIFTAMLLALPVNLGAAGISALFETRITKPYISENKVISPSMAAEGTFIACLYALLLVLDTIICYAFLKNRKESLEMTDEETHLGYYMIIEDHEEK